jgi:hypothetical protein
VRAPTLQGCAGPRDVSQHAASTCLLLTYCLAHISFGPPLHGHAVTFAPEWIGTGPEASRHSAVLAAGDTVPFAFHAQAWFGPPWQVHAETCAAFVTLPFGAAASRQRFGSAMEWIVPSVWICHAWFGLPWQVPADTFAPDFTPPPSLAASRHSDIETSVVGFETVGVGVGVGVSAVEEAVVEGVAATGVVGADVAVGTPGTVELLVSVLCHGRVTPSATPAMITTAANAPPMRIARRLASG